MMNPGSLNLTDSVAIEDNPFSLWPEIESWRTDFVKYGLQLLRSRISAIVCVLKRRVLHCGDTFCRNASRSLSSRLVRRLTRPDGMNETGDSIIESISPRLKERF